jgi:serine/threonine protein kinase
LLQECVSENIVSLIDVGYDARRHKFYQVMSLGRCDLYNIISNGYFAKDPIRVKEAFFQIVTGLCHIHVHQYIHRDLKSENIIVFGTCSEGYQFKLCDFGLSRRMNAPGACYTSYMVTLYYRPPENLLRMENYTQSIDIWSLGCIFVEMMLGDTPFSSTSSQDMIKEQIATLYSFQCDSMSKSSIFHNEFKKLSSNFVTRKQNLWKKNIKKKITDTFGGDAYDLVMGMLQLEPEKRLTAVDVLSHRYFQYSPVKIPIMTLHPIYEFQDWRNKETGNFNWKERNYMFIECYNILRLYNSPFNVIITCFAFLNKFFFNSPETIKEDSDKTMLYNCSVINVTTKLCLNKVLNLKDFEEFGQKKALSSIRNRFLKGINFELNIRTGVDWFYGHQYILKSFCPKNYMSETIDLTIKLYLVAIFQAETLFKVPQTKLVETCEYLALIIMKHISREDIPMEYQTVMTMYFKEYNKVKPLLMIQEVFAKEVLNPLNER